MESQDVRCPFHEPSSDAPGGRNFPELTNMILIWQGGGVYMSGATVSFYSCTINHNQATGGMVSEPFHEPSSDAPAEETSLN